MADTTIKLSGTYDSIEAYELLEEMRETADNYLPLTGGEISGDLIVAGQLSGTLTGNVNGNVTGNVTGTASGNLPLSGGTLTGAIKGNPLTLTADDGNGNTVSLVGNPNGSLTWNAKEVERVHASGTGYIRYVSGLQMCWNRVSSVTTSGTATTFPVAFKAETTPRLSVATATNAVAIGFSSLTDTGCTFKSASGTQALDYIAIGYWK